MRLDGQPEPGAEEMKKWSPKSRLLQRVKGEQGGHRVEVAALTVRTAQEWVQVARQPAQPVGES